MYFNFYRLSLNFKLIEIAMPISLFMTRGSKKVLDLKKDLGLNFGPNNIIIPIPKIPGNVQ